MASPNPSHALPVALEEIRRRYDDEERRRTSIETKNSGLLVLNGALITLISISTGIIAIGRLWQGLSLALILVSIAIGGNLLRGRSYKRPIKNLSWYSAAITRDPIQVQSRFLQLYVRSLRKNQRVNDKRFKQLLVGIILTAVALGIFIFGALGGPDALGCLASAPTA